LKFKVKIYNKTLYNVGCKWRVC